MMGTEHTHSFGGSRLDRYISEYEPEPVPAVDPPAPVVDPPAPAPVVDPPAPVPAVDPAAEQAAWFAPYAEQIGNVAETVREMREWLTTPTDPEPVAAPAVAELELARYVDQTTGQVDLEGLVGALEQRGEARVQAAIQAALADVSPVVTSVAEQEGEKIALRMFGELEQKPEVGKFDHQEALDRARGYIAQGVDPIEAVQLAAVRQSAFEKTHTPTGDASGLSAEAKAAVIAEYREQLKTAGVHLPEPTSSGPAEPVKAPPDPRTVGGVDRYTAIADNVVAMRAGGAQ